jgi:hypothetical protein
MNSSPMDISGARELLTSGLGRGFLRAATAVETAGTATALSAPSRMLRSPEDALDRVPVDRTVGVHGLINKSHFAGGAPA